MERLMKKVVLPSVVIAIVLFGAAEGTKAGPITYQDTLFDSTPVVDSVSSSGTFDDPATARYFDFFANFGNTITIEALRLEQDLDPALWVFEGTFSDTSAFSGGSNSGFDSGDPGFIEFADDEISNSGPFGDPRAVFSATLPGTGQYTAAVTNFASGSDDGGDGRFDFEITATNTSPVPEPSSFALLGIGAIGLAGYGRRRRRKATTEQAG